MAWLVCLLPLAFLAGRHNGVDQTPNAVQERQKGANINKQLPRTTVTVYYFCPQGTEHIVGRLGNNHTLYQDRNLCLFFS